ncbi:hypothetical protein TNCV_2281371 [Trichonephila clavipes]|nr:hypothetical protein TNCV_2281371 [Trichonephila clavipes]
MKEKRERERLTDSLTNHDISGTIKPTDLKFGREMLSPSNDRGGKKRIRVLSQIAQHAFAGQIIMARQEYSMHLPPRWYTPANNWLAKLSTILVMASSPNSAK